MMASAVTAGAASLFALGFCWIVGLPLARSLFPDQALAVALAPTLGWAAFSAAALPVLSIVGFGPASVATLAGAALLASLFALARQGAAPAGVALPRLAFLAAALCAVAPAMALLPKETAEGVLLAAPIFDHSKVAIVDEIARNGLPVQNPFYGAAGASSALAYYYLWHFSAAMLSLLPAVSGWEADVALTGFTAFATLVLVMGLAVRVSGRASAAYWAIALGIAASGRLALKAVFGPDLFETWFSTYPGLGTVMVQATWAPQHVAAAACAVLAALLIERLAAKPDAAAAATLGLVAAAGFGSSVWIGGFVFAPVAACAALVLLLRRDLPRPGAFALGALFAALIAVAAAAPILRDQIAAAAARPGGLPLAFRPYEVLGPRIADAVRRWLDLPAYWAALLPIDFPAVYPAGALALAGALRAAGAPPAARRFAALAAVVALASFGVAWLFVSTLLNNDLGWRAVLPGALVLTAFAAAGLACWTARPFRGRRIAAGAAGVALLVAGLADGLRFVGENTLGLPSASAQAFARSPALWEAVRRHAGPTERIANDPGLFAAVTHWPINISWALFADRRSCYAGWEFARPFAPVPKAEVDRLDRAFRDAFAGALARDDAFRLFVAHDCELIVRTRMDGDWRNGDPFAGDPRYRLVEQEPTGSWRLYRIETETRR